MTDLAPAGLLRDDRAEGVLRRLQEVADDQRRRSLRSPTHERRLRPDPALYPDVGFSVHPEQGELMYLLCRAARATRVVEFASSVGVSTIYLAAAVRDNGGGVVIGTEIVPAKVAAARQNLEEAGLAEYVELREGDVLDTLAELDGPIDFLLLDGWPNPHGTSLAVEVLKLLTPRLRPGAMVLNDNGELDYLEYVRAPEHGFRSMLLPIGGGGELSVLE